MVQLFQCDSQLFSPNMIFWWHLLSSCFFFLTSVVYFLQYSLCASSTDTFIQCYLPHTHNRRGYTWYSFLNRSFIVALMKTLFCFHANCFCNIWWSRLQLPVRLFFFLIELQYVFQNGLSGSLYNQASTTLIFIVERKSAYHWVAKLIVQCFDELWFRPKGIL